MKEASNMQLCNSVYLSVIKNSIVDLPFPVTYILFILRVVIVVVSIVSIRNSPESKRMRNQSISLFVHIHINTFTNRPIPFDHI